MRGHKAIVIGGGTMGTDIASIFIANGLDAEVVEPGDEARAVLPDTVMASAKEIGMDKPPGAVRAIASLEEIDWDGAVLLVECVTEDLAIKRQVFARLEAIAPPALPLTSNSSGFPISHIAEGFATAGRMVGLHFFMPAHLVPCVEVIVGERSDPAVVDDVQTTMTELGKRPVRVNKDIPGFLGNRIQAALLREALALLDGGYASAEDIDAVVQYSFGFRFLAAGPLLQKDISGSASLYTSSSTVYPTLNNGSGPGPALQRMHAEKKWGMKSGEGFYRWDDESMRKAKERYARALRRSLAVLDDRDP